MSKTIEEIGLIVGGIALVALSFTAPFGIYISIAVMSAMQGIGVTAALAGVALALTPAAPITIQNGTLSVANPVAYRRVCYGKTGINAGAPTYAEYALGSGAFQNGNPSGGDYDHQCLHLVYTLTGHQIYKFLSVIIDDIQFDIQGTGGNNALVPQGTYNYYTVNNAVTGSPYYDHSSYGIGPLIYFEFDTGDPTNSSQPFPGLAAISSSWGSNCLQRGCAKVHIVLRYSATLQSNRTPVYPAPINPYSGGRIPNLRFLIIGKPVTDTRLGGADAWQADTEYSYYPTPTCIVDTNGNLQMCSISPGFESGAVMPTWNLTLGGFTNDGATSNAWLNLGPVPGAPDVYSNPALCTYDWLTNGEYGEGAATSTIDISSVNAAANICDAILIPTGFVGTSDAAGPAAEPLYQCDGMFEESTPRGDVLKALCQSMAGFAVPPGDMWRIYAGAWVPPTITITDNDLRDSIKGDFRLSLRDVANSIKGRFYPAFLPGLNIWTHSIVPNWQETDFPPYMGDGNGGRPNFIAEDGGSIIWKDVQLIFTTSLWACQRIAKILLMQMRNQVTLHLACKLSVFELSAGDTVTFIHARWNALNPPAPTTYFVQQATLVLDTQGGVPALGVDLVLRQTDVSVYSFGTSTEYIPYGTHGM